MSFFLTKITRIDNIVDFRLYLFKSQKVEMESKTFSSYKNNNNNKIVIIK